MSQGLPALLEARAGTPDGQQRALAALRLLQPALAQWSEDLEALECKANALWLSGRTQEAAATYDRVLAKAPRRELTLDCAGTLAGQMRRYLAAISYWERAVKENPHRWRYRYMLAFAHAQQYNWRSALYECQRALELHPASFDTRFLLVGCHLGVGETSQARAEFERLLEFQPPNRDGLRQWFDQEMRKATTGK
jgi:tetratricopeptide (TPR) repeat protein